MLFLVLILLFVLVLHLDGQIAILVDVHLEVILRGARSSKLYFVFFIIFLDIDSRCCDIYARHPTCVQHVIEIIVKPIVHVS